ncbi:MAG: pyrroline-5-carboxylate reductase [Candidatus Moranbacteria bacterium]|nr:pyrroline-5-carboxylate reductase [Candidatus Moranbacteria bacterium]
MNKSEKINIGIFGFGNMGRSIFSVLTKNKKADSQKIFICSLDVRRVSGAICVASVGELLNSCDIVFLCIKPQNFYNLSPKDSKIIRKKSVIIISIMAGVTIANIKRILPSKKIIRTMPNLALQAQGAVTGWHTIKNNFSKKELRQVTNILNSFGLTIFTKNEDMLNAITAISGSGPAYVFLFINALAKAAESLGFSSKEARQIAMQTVKGSFDYAQQADDSSLDILIKKVTSKKGTTEAALKKLNVSNFYRKWQQVARKAYERAKELSNYDIK